MTAVEWTQAQHESPAPLRAARERSRSEPVRTCIGCRKRELAAELLRIVVQDAGDPQTIAIVPDPRRRQPGRGAWLHPSSSCLSFATRRRAFGRALRVSGYLDISALEHYVENRHEHS
ncbi:YlxR family protein [Nocardia crassostreae]|uniref:YlxR family protein n=1 Tax=Nocardia crassostreae TaxID=53428 RepID=UPI000A0753A8|nr:YlxR family protein [Nocardia crassostreae]